MHVHQRLINLAAISIIAIIGLLAYSNSFDVPFYFDDYANIQHPDVQINDISRDTISKALLDGHIRSRPVSNFSFALNHYFSGDRVQSYHLVNVFIHCLAGIILFFLFKETCKTPAVELPHKDSWLIAFFAALIWVSHPLCTQSVTYVVQRMNSLSSMFYIVSLLFYIVARRCIGERKKKWTIESVTFFLLALAAGFLAMGSKEIAATLPLTIFIYEFYFFRKSNVKWLKKNIVWIGVIVLIPVALAWFYTNGNLEGALLAKYETRSFTLEQRLLTQPRVIMIYLSLIFYPHPDRLFLDHDVSLSSGLFDPFTTLLSISGLVAIVFVVIWTAKKSPLVSFSLLWFFITQLVESTIVPLEIMYEHRTYLPSMFIAFLFVYLSTKVLRSFNIAAPIFLSIIILFSWWTFKRNEMWRDPVALWLSNTIAYPQNARAHNNLGTKYIKLDSYAEAEAHFEKALSIKPRSADVLNNLAAVALHKGNLELAENCYRSALEYKPRYISARMALAYLYVITQRFDLAQQQYKSVYELAPEYSTVNMKLGQMELLKNNPEKALLFLQTALPRQKQNKALHAALAEAYRRLGDAEQSIYHFEELLKIDYGNLIALYNLALLYSETGELEKAESYYTRAYSIQTQMVPVAYNYGNFLLRSGRLESAEKAYQKMVRFAPVLADSHNNLGLIYIQQEHYNEALMHFMKALDITPRHKVAKRNVELVQEILETQNE